LSKEEDKAYLALGLVIAGLAAAAFAAVLGVV
jgi:hypothetical protein